MCVHHYTLWVRVIPIYFHREELVGGGGVEGREGSVQRGHSVLKQTRMGKKKKKRGTIAQWY